ncbi:MAG: 5'-nucleotidase C-terminal domain-containing protein, partial [Sulfitobacter sp.]|nr:5'-nucleotidase C-terminal domain-containing protein [Sulfitobacter sp.]
MPSQTAYWNCHRLGPADSIAPAVPSAADAVVKLRLAGADLVIALAHLGIRDDGTEDALGIAAIPGLDALVAGHTHRRFPGEAHYGTPGVDPCRGLLHGRPAIMPGHGASDLGALDLHLAQKPSGLWKVQGHEARLLRNTMAVSPNRRVQRFGAKDHLKVRASLETVVGHSTVPLHNFFSLARPTNTCALLASAQARVIKRALKGTPAGELPLVAAAPAHTAGGREGPEHYLHLPPGPVLRRHLAGLAPFADEICALRIDGAGIRDWLEQSASLYERLDPERPDQPLIKAAEPRFNFDTLFGLSYGIDPGQVEGQRITHLLLDGQPVQRDQQFVMVTNQFRAGGGGGYRPWPVIHRSAVSLQHSVREELGQSTPLFPRDRPPWRFRTEKPLKALLATSTRALPYLEDIAHLSPEVRASEGDGFTTLALTLAPEW